MASSTVPHFKAALYEALKASNDPRLDKVYVSYGAPLPSPPPAFIWLGDVKGEQHGRAIGGERRPRGEEMELAVQVSVLSNTTDQRPVTERAYDIASAVEDLLRASPRLTGFYPADTETYGQLVSASVNGEQELAELADDSKREAVLSMTVWFQSRI